VGILWLDPWFARDQVLRTRGGCWFQCDKQQVHIGVEPDPPPSKKAHPPFLVFSLDELRQTLLARGINVVEGEDLPERRRFYADDPWGNHIEFVEMQRYVGKTDPGKFPRSLIAHNICNIASILTRSNYPSSGRSALLEVIVVKPLASKFRTPQFAKSLNRAFMCL
jgi:hypothetical protein